MNARHSFVIVATLAMLGAAGAAIALAPHRVFEGAPADRLEALIPISLGVWQMVPTTTQQVSLFAVDEDGGNPMQKVYDDSLLRTYRDGAGHLMMIAIAYDHVQREEDRVHRPEICYVAQGFHIMADTPVTLRIKGAPAPEIEGRRMLTQNGSRLEAVSYWIRIGSSFTQNPWRSRFYVIAEGMAGRLHDGVLVRVSELVAQPGDVATSYARQDEFLGALMSNLSPAATRLLASTAH
jgi:EpsI family protein